MNNTSDHYVYDETSSDLFYAALELFHDNWVDDLIFTGVGKTGTSLEDVKVIAYEKQHVCEKVVGGLLNLPVGVKVTGEKHMSCWFTHVTNDTIDMIVMMQVVENYPQQNHFLCSCWKMKADINMQDIKEFWSG